MNNSIGGRITISVSCVLEKVTKVTCLPEFGMENTCHRRKRNKYCLYQLEVTYKIHIFLLHFIVCFMTLLKLFDCLHLFNCQLLLLFTNLKRAQILCDGISDFSKVLYCNYYL